MAEKKLSKKALNKSFRNWAYGNLTCFSQEHMQTFGYLCAMLPLVEELYDTKEEQKEAMNTYTAFFNTEPQVGSIIVGITAGLEEAKANGNEDIDAEAINGIRAGLMGPLAGIGDSLVVGTLIPILLGIALGLSTGGSVVGPIFYIVAWNLIMAFGMKFLYFKGYELGAEDYVTKPFPMSVFQKKLSVVLGRLAKQSGGGDSYEDGALSINFSEMTASLSGKALVFTPLEYRLLKILTKNPQNVLTRQVLLEKLWDADGNFVDEHALTAAISRVRNKIETEGRQYIKTVYGMGYMWIGGAPK